MARPKTLCDALYGHITSSLIIFDSCPQLCAFSALAIDDHKVQVHASQLLEFERMPDKNSDRGAFLPRSPETLLGLI
jgi:hypothetical protein